ncbi:hypothetical protein TPHA_0L00650 [Tetrapisispora phaffii CBS 4417]|uniref:Rad21/Rec8-like protein N-terminal domain-containing protein n=1 Tax=Tetrapisispora phaffii (strain ATCC 24235 / CBS 4417 / NBRC 1672 / NRRL Y-8282 / UCD 70-5) TaxID=1071381 RepID=G8BZU3_TETPH|nr:hypothetical protein TPHA_0L00650 [Tetrapisispora phaffii CBS 4417]CCE65421.1 hypothetical protein TPHA_0L00650 [Tetrapisispora phaffii CBS 4417]
MSTSIGLARYPELILGTGENLEGVTTIWLLSTLGNINHKYININKNNSGVNSEGTSGSNLNRNVKKKDIVNVSIPKTCKVIENNSFELPLRYVSNLLFGITICYSKKTEYVLNDLTSLICQLQKKLYSSTSSRRMNNRKINVKGTTIYNGRATDKNNCVSSYLTDDPLYDINNIKNFETLLGIDGSNINNKTASINSVSLIKRNDLLNELSNFNSVDKNSNNILMENSSNFNKYQDPDDIHLDIDFDLNIDDINDFSQHGTVQGKSGTTESNSGLDSDQDKDLNINYKSQEFELNFDANKKELPKDNSNVEISNIDLDVMDNCDDSDTDGSFEDETFVKENELGQAIKRLKLNSKKNFVPLFSRLEIDQRISISTEQLKMDFDNYSGFMLEKARRKRVRNNIKNLDNILTVKKFTTAQENIKMFLKDHLENNYMFENWDILLNMNDEIAENGLEKENVRNFFNFIERGRKQFGSVTSTTRSSSNTVPSQEYGRNMVQSNRLNRESEIFDNDFYDTLNDGNNENNNNLLLNLEQIDEDLEEGKSFIHMNLDLPPSSFGRSTTRNNGTVGSVESDVINILQTKMLSVSKRGVANSPMKKKSSELESVSSHDTYGKLNTNIILDRQTRRFYDYIKERTSYVGKHTSSCPPFKRKILFEDLVPSRISGSANDSLEIEKPTSLNKNIAASAFLSLLTLASKDIVGIGEYHSSKNVSTNNEKISEGFKLMRPDDIIVYN